MKLLEKILIPIDRNNDTKEQLEIALDLASKFQSELILIRVLPNEAKIKTINSFIVDYTNKVFSELLEEIEKAGVKARTFLRYGNEFDQIVSLADEENINLVLVNNHFNSDSDENEPIDIISEKLIRKSEKPIWTIKKGSSNIPKKILCPVDYSEASFRALTNAIKLAKAFKSELHIVNVLPPLQESFSMRLNVDYNEENKNIEGKNFTEFEEFLTRFNFVNIDYKSKILKGKPYKQIVEYVNKNDIDLLFMGTTGKTFLQRVFIGSVTEMVLRNLPCSIVTAKSANLLNVKIDANISSIEKHFKQAEKLIESGFYEEAINQLKICLRINDLHVPAISKLVKVYQEINNQEQAEYYSQKLNEILSRLWDNKIELEIRRSFKV